MGFDQPASQPASDTTAKKRLTRQEIAKRILALVFALGITVVIIAAGGAIEQYQEYGYLGVFIFSILGNAT